MNNNSNLSFIFHKMSDCYRYLGAEVSYQVMAFENTTSIHYNMKEDIPCHAKRIIKQDEIKGIG